MERKYKIPPITWLKMTDYTHGWLQHEFGAPARIGNQHVVCIQHLQGVRSALRMETVKDVMTPGRTGGAMSCMRYNCIKAGLRLDARVVEEMYGVDESQLLLFVPIECPKLCLTPNGVLRRWEQDVCFSKKQAATIIRILRDEFWDAVSEFDEKYAMEHGSSYPAIEMVEAFCGATNTSMIHLDTIRREWQRRKTRKKNTAD